MKVTFSWDVSDKTVSEIGGRLIEDYILSSLPKAVDRGVQGLAGTFLECNVPVSQRAMEDIGFKWLPPDSSKTIDLLIDVKGHNEKKTGSRPNLVSIRKCKEFYSSKNNSELWIFYCRYTPNINVAAGKTDITYRIEEESFGPKRVFLLRRLSDGNMDPADIGSGGQILFAREQNIQLVERTRGEMLSFLDSLSDHISQLKEQKQNKGN